MRRSQTRAPAGVLLLATAFILQGCNDEEQHHHGSQDRHEVETLDGSDEHGNLQDAMDKVPNSSRRIAEAHMLVSQSPNLYSRPGGGAADVGKFDASTGVTKDASPGSGGRLLEAERAYERALLAGTDADRQAHMLISEQHLAEWLRTSSTTAKSTTTTTPTTTATTSAESTSSQASTKKRTTRTSTTVASTTTIAPETTGAAQVTTPAEVTAAMVGETDKTVPMSPVAEEELKLEKAQKFAAKVKHYHSDEEPEEQWQANKAPKPAAATGAALPTASPDADTPTTTEAPTTTAAPAPAVTMPGSEDLDDAEEKKEAQELEKSLQDIAKEEKGSKPKNQAKDSNKADVEEEEMPNSSAIELSPKAREAVSVRPDAKYAALKSQASRAQRMQRLQHEHEAMLELQLRQDQQLEELRRDLQRRQDDELERFRRRQKSEMQLEQIRIDAAESLDAPAAMLELGHGFHRRKHGSRKMGHWLQELVDEDA
ncbi:unnamed protein product [Effrenium voratum]|uniref:Uncharacterized protein n=1 Tax=Effrenium voratum TaxID=2562239 RepID=A0AA36NA33_9DINO|nr:unnamed protein product [Effrenium voratum]CAJ1421971.1 unnamed protein product [Effrenium voratum]